MEDYLLADMMKTRELREISEREFIDRLNSHPSSRHMRYYGDHPYYRDINHMRGVRRHEDIDKWEEGYMDNEGYMYSMNKGHMDKFSHNDAKHTVDSMYHFEGGKKHSGEYFDMNKAKEVKEMYKSILPHDIEVCDIYVAINAQYHDYVALFKSWNRNNVDHRVIESAIVFWFCDADYPGKSKIFDYFQMF